MANRKQKNIRKYRRAWNINIGMVVFFLIFIYICICIVSYMTKKHISVYEVKQGTIASDNTYTGLIFRTETVKTAAKSGYVNYFAREGQRVGVKSVVYTIDESGKTASLLEENEEAAALTSDDYKAIKSEITSFTNSFSENNFNALYDFKYSMDGTILELVHLNLLNNIDGIENNSSLFQIYKPDESGILTYSIDGFENVQPEQVTAEMFDEGNYSKTFLKNQELVSEGDPVYKLITDENWSVVIPLDKERSKDIPSDDYIEVTFSKDQTTAWAYVTQFESNGKKYAKLAFTNSMVRFATDRYLELELKLDDIEGLKIPVTSVVEKPFYVIPADYITHGGDSDEEGVLMEKYQEDGSVHSSGAWFNPPKMVHDGVGRAF